MKKKSLTTLIRLFFCCVGPLLAAGCSTLQEHTFTGKLWQNGELIDHYEPSPKTSLQLFQQDNRSDVLVIYNEEHEGTGKVRQRAYFLAANEKKIEQNKKPRFVNPSLAEGMQSVPITTSDASKLTNSVTAETALNGAGFRLFNQQILEGEYKLPVYVDMKTETKRVLLTPAAMTIDATGAGVFLGVLWLYANAPGLGR